MPKTSEHPNSGTVVPRVKSVAFLVGNWGVALRFTHELATWINHLLVIPAKAGIQFHISWRAVISSWIPAFAGMTETKLNDLQVAALYFRG
jgi:hypothetical protein